MRFGLYRFSLAALGLLSCGTALADPLPVVAVNREIGLSVTGNFYSWLRGGHSQYNSSYGGGSFLGGLPTSYSGTESYRNRMASWRPGFQADAAVMFDAFGIRNLYASAQFNLAGGNAHYRDRWSGMDSYYGPYRNTYSSNRNYSSTYTRGEIGKGFLFLSNNLLITPTAVGGYQSTGTSSFGSYGGYWFVGAALRADYALTNRLVLRGRAGWAELLDSGLIPASAPKQRARPVWQGSLGADYRLTHHIHITGGVEYAYVDRGHATDHYSYSEPYYSTASSNTTSLYDNGVTLRLGAAYQF